MAQISIAKLQNSVADLGALLGKYFLFVVMIVAGGVVFFWLQASGVIATVVENLLSSVGYLYSKSGIVSIGLIPLTIGLIVLAVYQLGYHVGHTKFGEWHISKYKLIGEAGPILGILGTMLGLVEALKGLDVSLGLQSAIQNMSIGVSQALWSSVYGLLLALVSYILQHLYASTTMKKET